MTHLSGYVLEMLRDGGKFALYRGRQHGNPSPILVLAPVAEQPAPAILARLEHKYGFAAEPQGMGMGLSICRSIVEAHGGSLWASPHVPHGTISRFTVPPVADTGSTDSAES